VNLGRVTWWTGHIAPVLALVSAVLGLGGAFWERLNHPITLGLTGAASGLVWWLDYALRNRLAKKEAARQAALENTPPAVEFVDARLLGARLIVAIKSTNGVPFKCRWVCVTAANQVVGGVQMQDVDVFPEALNENTLVFDDNLQLGRIVESYLELRFRYYSAYSAKLGNPRDLGLRTLTVAWSAKDGALTAVSPRQAA